MPAHFPIGKIKKDPRTALAAAAIFHIIVTLAVFAVGRAGLMPGQFDRDGIGEFARDSRGHKDTADQLVELLKHGQVGSWIKDPYPLHVKIYALSILTAGRVLGSNILAVEPVNLLYYLAMLALTFNLARITTGLRAAWLAACIVAFWPSLVLHTTQLLRDPLVLIAFLTLMTILVVLLKNTVAWRGAVAAGLGGATSIYVLWHTRPGMWLVITSILIFFDLLFLIKIIRRRQLFALSLAAIALLNIVALTTSKPATDPVSRASSAGANSSSIWSGIATARKAFAIPGGTTIDAEVAFNSPRDIIRYIPRALEIGYLAPFPSMWFGQGYNVGVVGRLVSGIEMILTYPLELFACVFLWKNRTHLSSWLLLATSAGVLALGLIVANIGTLYRMRYPFWTIVVIIAAGALAGRPHAQTADN